MNSFFKKLTVLILLILSVGIGGVQASGRMEVSVGQNVSLTAETELFAPTYKWVVTRKNEILSTQANRSFRYTFPFQGAYTINLSVISDDKVENTIIEVLAGDRFPRPFTPDADGQNPSKDQKLELALETLPSFNDQNQVPIIGNEGRVEFLLARSKGNIIEYRIDQDIFIDSDGNGIANDDIDNANDDSYLTGAPWLARYKNEGSPRVTAQVTLVDNKGEKVSEQIEILFTNSASSGDLKATLDTLPAADSDEGLISLYQDGQVVAFYARRSTGNIVEYRIDRNIFEDSDGDGDPANDIDNINDASFRNGDVFEVEYQKTDDQIIAQLIVVGSGGQGSRIQKGIVFGDDPALSDSGLTEEDNAIRLIADKSLVFQGDPLSFSIEGLSLNLDQYIFDWDFDGDGSFDKQTTANNKIDHIYTEPGLYKVRVKISDLQENEAEKSMEVIVREKVVTAADFTFEVEGSKVSFSNISTVNSNLADPTLSYRWSFGDTDPDNFELFRDQQSRKNPVYTYSKPGAYNVSLTVVDSDDVTSTKALEVLVSEVLVDDTAVNIPSDADTDSAGGSFIFTVLKIFLFIVLGLLALVLLVVGGFFLFIKLQHPELTLEELVDEFKIKVLSLIGMSEALDSDHFSSNLTSNQSPDSSVNEAQSSSEASGSTQPTETEEVVPASEEVSNPTEVQQGPMPSWLQEENVVEGEVAEEPDSQSEEFTDTDNEQDFSDNKAFDDSNAEAFDDDLVVTDEGSDFDAQSNLDTDFSDDSDLNNDFSEAVDLDTEESASEEVQKNKPNHAPSSNQNPNSDDSDVGPMPDWLNQ